MKRNFPGRPHRIAPAQSLRNPIYYITITTHRRRKILNRPSLHESFRQYMLRKSDEGLGCGRYVIMPDHLHFFLRLDLNGFSLGKTVGYIKQHLSATLKKNSIEQPHWQKGFFDHIIRSSEQHALKNNYVLYNPVKAEFVENPQEWEFSGTITDLMF